MELTSQAYSCYVFSSRCDPQKVANCKEKAEKGQKARMRSPAELLQLRRMSVELKETPPTLFGKRGPEGKEKGCVMYVGLVLHVAVLHLRCAVYLREPKCCKLHTL